MPDPDRLILVSHPPAPELVADLWRRFHAVQSAFGYGFSARVTDFVAVVTAEDTDIYLVGPGRGAIYFTEIVGPKEANGLCETTASAHVLLWGSPMMYRRVEIGRAACLDLMRRRQVRRIICEVPDWNPLVFTYARRGGLVPLGKLRNRVQKGGKWFDSYLLDALEEDLLQSAGVRADGRHRGLRGHERGPTKLQTATA